MNRQQSLVSSLFMLGCLLAAMTAPGSAKAHSINAWVASFGSNTPWQKINSSGVSLSKLRFADFDGNGRTDIFRTSGGKWYVSFDGVGQWQQINSSNVALSNLRFGDFNGNGKADVFRTSGGKWYVSTDGVGQWKKINASNIPLSNLRFGDFNGNGKTDVFRSGGGKWYVSTDGVGKWKKINSSNVSLSNLRFADFNGNGKTDVFRSGGGKWYVSFDGVGSWQQINTSNVSIGNLRFGDFDGNGRADVFRTNGSRWFVSFNGTGQWQQINVSGISLSKLRFGDFNGDNRTDVMTTAGQTHVNMAVRRFTTATLTNARADTILANASAVLETNNGSGDRACLVHFRRDGAVTAFNTGDGSIDSEAEFDAVIDLPGRVKVVNQINWCGRIIPNVLGCAPTPGDSFAVVRTTANIEGIVWAHEFGHNQSLPDRNDNNNFVMFRSAGTNRTRVNGNECSEYKG